MKKLIQFQMNIKNQFLYMKICYFKLKKLIIKFHNVSNQIFMDKKIH